METMDIIFLALMTLIMACVSITSTRRILVRLKGMQITEGAVVDSRAGDWEVNVWASVVRFRTEKGMLIEFCDPGYSQWPSKIGTKVKVVYSNGRPQEARIAGLWRLYSLPLVSGAFSIVFLSTMLWRLVD